MTEPINLPTDGTHTERLKAVHDQILFKALLAVASKRCQEAHLAMNLPGVLDDSRVVVAMYMDEPIWEIVVKPALERYRAAGGGQAGTSEPISIDMGKPAAPVHEVVVKPVNLGLKPGQLGVKKKTGD